MLLVFLCLFFIVYLFDTVALRVVVLKPIDQDCPRRTGCKVGKKHFARTKSI